LVVEQGVRPRIDVGWSNLSFVLRPWVLAGKLSHELIALPGRQTLLLPFVKHFSVPVCILLNVVTHPADVSVNLALLVLHHDLVLVPRAARLGNLLLLFFFGLFIFL